MSQFLDSTTVIDLWLMDSTSSDSTSVWIENEVEGGANLYIEGSYGLISGTYNNALQLYENTYLYSDSTAPETITFEWIAKYNDSTSSDWWVDGEWHVFAYRREGTLEEFVVDSTSVESITDSTNQLGSSISIYSDSTDYAIDIIRISNIWRTNSQLLTLDEGTYVDHDFDLRVLQYTTGYLDYNYILAVSDYIDATTFIPIPDFIETNIFLPIPDWVDYVYEIYTSDYVDADLYYKVRAIGFREASFYSPYIVTQYTDSGNGINEGIFINIETYFGFEDQSFYLGSVTDNLLDSAHVLVSTKDGHGSESPVMLTEYGPYFGYSSTFRILHSDWIRHFQRYYGYNSQNEALAAVSSHESAGGILVEQVWDPPDSGWAVCRWRDTEFGAYQYAFFNNVGTCNTYIAALTLRGKYDIDSSTWQTTMPYFPVYVVMAAYSQENPSPLLMEANDLTEAYQTMYIWTTDVSDDDDDTWWQNEDGMSIPHWLRVIF